MASCCIAVVKFLEQNLLKRTLSSLHLCGQRLDFCNLQSSLAFTKCSSSSRSSPLWGLLCKGRPSFCQCDKKTPDDKQRPGYELSAVIYYLRLEESDALHVLSWSGLKRNIFEAFLKFEFCSPPSAVHSDSDHIKVLQTCFIDCILSQLAIILILQQKVNDTLAFIVGQTLFSVIPRQFPICWWLLWMHCRDPVGSALINFNSSNIQRGAVLGSPDLTCYNYLV